MPLGPHYRRDYLTLRSHIPYGFLYPAVSHTLRPLLPHGLPYLTPSSTGGLLYPTVSSTLHRLLRTSSTLQSPL